MAWEWIQGGKPAAKKALSETLNQRINAKGNKQTKYGSFGEYGGDGIDLDAGFLKTKSRGGTPKIEQGGRLLDRYFSKKNAKGERVVSSKKTGGIEFDPSYKDEDGDASWFATAVKNRTGKSDSQVKSVLDKYFK